MFAVSAGIWPYFLSVKASPHKKAPTSYASCIAAQGDAFAFGGGCMYARAAEVGLNGQDGDTTFQEEDLAK